MPEVVVIGGGISGLTCAWQIRRAGLATVVLEADSRCGGVIETHEIDGFLVESGPNTILPTAESTKMIGDTGLTDQLITAQGKADRFIYVNGRLRRVPWVLSLSGFLRALGEPLVWARPGEADESLQSFFTRRFGRQVHDRLLAPFVSGIYAGDTAALSIEATFPRMRELEQRYGSVALGMLRGALASPRPRLSSFRRGMKMLPLGLARELDIRYGVGDMRLEESGVVDSTAGRFEPKAVVLAVPADAAADLLDRFDSQIGRTLRSLEYAPIRVAATALKTAQLKRPIEGFGFLIPRTEGFHMLGTLFSSSLFPGRAPDGQVLLTSFLGGALEPDLIEWPEERLWETVETELRTILGVSGPVRRLSLFSYSRAIPQYRLGHAAWRDAALARIGRRPGLFLTGNYLTGVSVPASMEQGRRTGDAVIEYVRRIS